MTQPLEYLHASDGCFLGEAVPAETQVLFLSSDNVWKKTSWLCIFIKL